MFCNFRNILECESWVLSRKTPETASDVRLIKTEKFSGANIRFFGPGKKIMLTGENLLLGNGSPTKYKSVYTL
jgi:hypothetical protein